MRHAMVLVTFLWLAQPPQPSSAFEPPHRGIYEGYVSSALAFADSCRLQARWDLALEALEAALAAARHERDHLGEARIRVAMVEQWNEKAFYVSRSFHAQAQTALADASAAVEQASPGDVRARLTDTRGMQIYVAAFRGQGTFDDAMPHFEEARRLREVLGAGLAESWFHIGLVHQQSKRLTDAKLAFEKALSLASAANDRVAMGFAERHLGFLAWLARDLEAAESGLRRSLELRERAGHTLGRAFTSVTLAEFLMETNRSSEEAQGLLERALEIAEASRITLAAASAAEALGSLLAPKRRSESHRHLVKAEAYWREYGDSEAAEQVATKLKEPSGETSR